jgi:hypothetical protein
MLLKVDPQTRLATRVRGQRLQEFGLDERGLQDILFHSLDRLLPDDELLLIMQSRHWQEEPDLMAVGKAGQLYIFELKAWESQSENILQALRYGQIYGSYTYENLQRLYEKFGGPNQDLKTAHKAQFDIQLTEDEFNRKQIFVVMTNGLDHKTREAVQYWRQCGLDVRPWVYRIYNGNNGEMLLEISPFAVNDNPYSDFTEGYYILNTNYRNSMRDHEDMLTHKKAAAYFPPWKYKIERLSKGDVVFLYQSGVGIIAVGIASGKLEKRPYQGDPQHANEEYAMPLTQFKQLEQPITAADVKEITGINYRFMSTMFALDADSGKALYDHILLQRRGLKVKKAQQVA